MRHLRLPYSPRILDARVSLANYEGPLRQTSVVDLGHEEPTSLIFIGYRGESSRKFHPLYIYVQPQLSLDLSPTPTPTYAQRGANILQIIFKEHFQDFTDSYEQKYAPTYGRFRLERITKVVEHFISCGDYTQGIARIQCTNPECREEFFRPFSCKGFHLCPSCSQKRTLLFAQYAENDLLLRLPHRFLTFSLPKCLRVFFRHDRKLFDATDFIALLTQHLPPKGVQYIRRYGLYSSRNRGKWIEKPYAVRLAPDGWKQKHLDSIGRPPPGLDD